MNGTWQGGGTRRPDTDLFTLLAAANPYAVPATAPAPPVVVPERARYDAVVGIAQTPLGPLSLALTGQGLAACTFESEDSVAERLSRLLPEVGREEGRLDPVRRELDAYFEGRLSRFSIPLDLRLVSDFGKVVLRSLLDVGYGCTRTYRVFAERLGKTNALRAMGNTLNTNPLCVVVPCHRVVAEDFPEHVGDYAGGAAAKRRLLRLEQEGPGGLPH